MGWWGWKWRENILLSCQLDPTAQIESAPHLVQRQHESPHLTYDAPYCKFQVEITPIIFPKVIHNETFPPHFQILSL